MSMEPSSQTQTTRKPQRDEHLRWLTLAALLLIALLLCCASEVVMQLLLPRDQATDLNLLSRDRADYSPWRILLDIAAVPEELPQAIAAERVTATAQAQTNIPTRGIVGSLPTADVPRVPPPRNAPTSTPINVLELEAPTVTPRPVRPTILPVISTAVAIEPSATSSAGTAPTATSLIDRTTETPTRGPNAPTNTSTTTTQTRVAQTPTDTSAPTRGTNAPTETATTTRSATPTSSVGTPTTPRGTTTPTNETATSTAVTSATPTSTTTGPTTTSTQTATATSRPATATNTSAPTNTSGPTSTSTTIPTNTNEPTSTPTNTIPPTATDTPTTTNQPTDTATSTLAPTNTATATLAPTNTATATLAPTNTTTATPTVTAIATATETATATATETATATATATNTPVTPTGDAYISQSPGSTSTQVNESPIDFTITVENRGTADITLTSLQAEFTDSNLPSGVVFGLVGCSDPDGGVDCPANGTTLTWSGSHIIGPGQSFTISASGGFAQIGPPTVFSPVTIRYADIITVQITGASQISYGPKTSIQLSPAP